MVQLCKSQGFSAETLAGDFVGQSAGGQYLQRNIAIQLLIMSAIHHAHAAGSNVLDNAVVAEDVADDRL
jgi:hypothetical protein